MKLLCFLLFLGFVSCSPDNRVIENTESFQKLIFTDTIEVVNQDISIAAINPKIYVDSLLFTMDGAYQNLFMYNLNSDSLIIWDNDFIKGTHLPAVSLHDYTLYKGYIYMFYKAVYEVYQFDLLGNFIKKISIQHSDEGSNAEGRELFEITDEGQFIMNQEYNAAKSLQHLFQKTKQIGIFNQDGSALASFGSYPEVYKQGSMVLTKFYNYLVNEEVIYTLGSTGPPELIQYNLTGKTINSEKFHLEDFNEEIYYYENSPFDSKINDQITQIGKDVVRDDSLIYFSYQRYDNENPPEGYESLEYKLGVLDLANESVNTFLIGGSNLVGTTKRMIPQIQDGKIYFLLSPNDIEKEQLLLVEAEIR
ncbi:hypothetical protein SAMN05661096_02572 [Marivirga sericea]|uniref:TolB-like 6-blade propeller-like n=1 Tax=Marivirga sericea TaxID=1028 RepID=A0A1X7KEC7_9BACT|nr:hypothetical protein [Marivirga sericea]SMG38795.1 hypothetical protein SAMN05661096_02572 [Marivirga sericea]